MSRAYPPQPDYNYSASSNTTANNASDMQFFGGGSSTGVGAANYSYNDNQYMSNSGWDSTASGTIGSGGSTTSTSNGMVDYDNEPPLLEELGIDFKLILERTLAVSIPFKSVPALHNNTDADLAGPLIFALALGTALLFAGKVQYGYVYGFGLLGTIAMYFVVNLMSHEGAQNQWPVSFDRTMSILGYSLLPIVLLATVNIFVNLRGYAGFGIGVMTILWSTTTATRMFEAALEMREQRYLIAYPATMLYACFTLLTIF